MAEDIPSSQSLAHRLRLAIAIAVLRCKPVQQSHASYILHLRTQFPLRHPEADEREAWRERALSLERQVKDLQARYDNEHIELLSLRETATAQKTTGPAKDSSAAGDNKKKAKKRTTPKAAEPKSSSTSRRLDLKTVLDSHSDPVVLRTPSRTSVLHSLETLDKLVSIRARERSAAPDDLLVVLAKRSIDALGDLLATLLPPSAARPRCPADLAALSTLCHRLLAAVVPLLAKSTRTRGAAAPAGSPALEDVLGLMSARLLMPIVRAFGPASRAFLAGLFAPNREGKTARAQDDKGVDIRPDVFAILGGVLAALQEVASAKPSVNRVVRHTINDTLAIEAIRELQKLYEDTHSPVPATATTPASRALKVARTDRIDKLARKDALWYLCNVLHLVLPLEPGTSLPAQDVLLEDTIYATLSAVLRRSRPAHRDPGDGGPCDSPKAPSMPAAEPRYDMDEVERGMVLAVVERAWLGSGT